MRTVAILNQKGGVGKTTMAFHFGWYIAEQGRRVLMVDLDPQGTLSSLMGVTGCDAQSLFTAPPGIAPPLSVQSVRLDGQGGSTSFGVISSDERLQAFEAVAGGHQYARSLQRGLRSISGYDYAIVDCPPSLGGFAINALLAATDLVIPTTVRTFSVAGLDRVLEMARSAREDGENPSLRVLGVVLNQFNPAARHQKIFERDVAEGLTEAHEALLIGAVPASIKIEEALYSRQPIWTYAQQRPAGERDRSSMAAADAYRDVARAVMEKLRLAEAA